jgi:sulfatase modifying factor 1
MRRAAIVVVLGAAVAAAALVAARGARAPHAGDVPPGMVALPGGRTHIGSDHGEAAERPPFDVDVAPFLLDVHPVTVAEFARFVAATGYRTQAERLGNAGVFDPERPGWSLVDGATWRRPRGPDAPPAPDDHPVTQVSWYDAGAYCAWAGKRLPTEIEWEHAARNGRDDRTRYAWGDALVVAGRYMANTWQGHFPTSNTVADGWRFTSPVGVFGRTPAGLTDMGGNVWQWCADWFRPYALRDAPFTPGPESEKVLRGGSFLCDPEFCHGFRVSARGHSTPDTGLLHVGFRCARDAAQGASGGGGSARSGSGNEAPAAGDT